MKESLLDITQNISDAKKVEKKERFPHPSVARLHGAFNNETRTYWLCNSSRMPSMYQFDNLKRYGIYIPKNASIIVSLLNKNIGDTIEYDTINNIKRVQHNKITLDSKSDLINKKIEIAGDSQIYSYTDIDVLIQALIKKKAEIEDKERKIAELEQLKQKEADTHKRGQMTKEQNKYREEKRVLTLQQEEMSNLTRYIREQGKLRFNPILDPVQNRIKTSNLFDGKTIIIDGGPGTGKTTTMIQRLKYLTDDYAINEDAKEGLNKYKLTASQRQNLFDAIDSGRDWVFFSPSELLKDYLAAAMNEEGLTGTTSKVWSWKEYLKKVCRENYLFIDPTNDNAPFVACKSSEPLIYQCSGVISAWESFYLGTLKQITNRFPKIDEKGEIYKWNRIALNIKDKFDNTDGYGITQFIRLFLSLESAYAADCRELLAENRNTVSEVAEQIFALARSEENIYSRLKEMIAVVNPEPVDDVEEETESIESDSDKIISLIKTWYKRYCYSTKNKEVKLTARQQQLSDLLLPLLLEEHKKRIPRVGELALFEQFAKYTRGVTSNMFNGIPAKYKQFRRLMASDENNKWNHELLNSLLHKRNGKELHIQEQALLVGFINNLVKDAIRLSPNIANHYYISAYRELSRPIIGIDEATDFSECDIYAMESLQTMDYHSLTLCGDMMQRLTKIGITSWEELDNILKDAEVVKMLTSYRQSSRLLEVAKALYKDSIGDEPEYRSYLKSKKVPEPLAFISKDEQAKIDWIEKRIKEIYSIYKRLPSIAIFLNNRNEIPDFVDALKETDFIYDTDIEVIDGSSEKLASSNQIRVYPINVVKGMEFDVVFFHNIDNSSENTDLIKRYIYVGVSRAAFFLGATLSNDDKSITKYFVTGKTWSTVSDSGKQSEVEDKQDSSVAFVEEGKIELLSDKDIEKLSHVFDKKASTYKFFWFLSILKIYKESGNTSIFYRDILIKMASIAWRYVFMEKGEFPIIDQIPGYLNTIDNKIESDKSTKGIIIDSILHDYYDKWELDTLLSPLLKNVPYRFLSPWIPFTDNSDVVEKSNYPETRCPYALHDNHITINPIWGDYLIDNYDKLAQFIDNELRIYLKCDRVVKAMTVTEFTKICRELQGRYREKMGEPMGYGPGALSPNKQINMLVNGEKTGKNFVNEFTFNYAKQRVRNLQAHETINSYRLFNNMLSSQPMAFNLFCPFIQMLEEGRGEDVTNIFKAIFPDKHIGKVTEVALEYLHTDIKNYLNDCTAMDAIVRYQDTDGKPAFIAIETKYTDVLGENTSNKDRAQDKYREWIKRIKMFKPETEKDLLSGKKAVTQIYRNFLLTECYGIVEKANRCYSVVLAPAQHPTTEKEVASLKNELLPKYQFKISAVSLEDFIKKTLMTCPKGEKAPFLYFYERYIPNI